MDTQREVLFKSLREARNALLCARMEAHHARETMLEAEIEAADRLLGAAIARFAKLLTDRRAL